MHCFQLPIDAPESLANQFPYRQISFRAIKLRKNAALAHNSASARAASAKTAAA
jgi:hypothetical protein